MLQLDYLNTCASEAFTAAPGEIFEHSPWVARAAVAQRRFVSLAALHDAMTDAVRAAPAWRRPAIILRAHPEFFFRCVAG
jgi:2-oxo-4-hydroxy-4-carboxy-5-ureidoimidazoline decarboxylase